MSKAKAFSHSQPLTAPIFYILLSLATKERHGYDIMKQVQRDSHDKVKLGAGTLYGAIKRMLEDKLIMELENTENERRRYYQLTEKGRSIFTTELQRYNEVVAVAKRDNLFVNPITKPVFTYA